MTSSQNDGIDVKLNEGESRSLYGGYQYLYTMNNGRTEIIYAPTLSSLREKELNVNFSAELKHFYNDSTFDDIYLNYFANRTDLRAGTKSTYGKIYNKWIKPTIGKEKIVNIDFDYILKHYILMSRELSVGSIGVVNEMVAQVLDVAVRNKIISSNPAKGIMKEIKKYVPAKEKERHALSKEEQEMFLNFVSRDVVSKTHEPLYVFLFGTGTRIGEALGLTWQDCDFETNTISINHQLQTIGGKKIIGPPKSESGIRLLPMLPQVKEQLLILKAYQEENKIASPICGGLSGFVFLNKKGGLQDSRILIDALRRTIARCNSLEEQNAKSENRKPTLLRRFVLHDIRHTFCTRLCEADYNTKVIQKLMGHSNYQTTMNIYTEVTKAKQDSVFEKMREEFLLMPKTAPHNSGVRIAR